MYAYAVQASLGDDVYEAEPSTNALEEHIAKLTGKEAALFVASGTMSNQLALRTHLKQPPYSVLADYRSHIHKWVYVQCYLSHDFHVLPYKGTRLEQRRYILVRLSSQSYHPMVRFVIDQL